MTRLRTAAVARLLTVTLTVICRQGRPQHAEEICRIIERRAAAARVCTDAAAWRAATDVLFACDTPPVLRHTLALVLGTVGSPDPDALHVAALAEFGADAEFAHAALLALGATRDPPDDDAVFDLAERPWGAAGPGGIGITVRRAIDDVGVRGAIEAALRRDEPAVRRAAAVARRHSLRSSDAQGVFEAALATESADAVAQEIGESLVRSVARSPESAKRERVLTLVLRRAREGSMDGLRRPDCAVSWRDFSKPDTRLPAPFAPRGAEHRTRPVPGPGGERAPLRRVGGGPSCNAAPSVPESPTNDLR